MKLTKIAAGVSASVALLSAGSFASVVPQASVQAASKYQVRLSKKAYVYTSKGKKTKKSYKKNAKLTVYGTKTIKGKKYYSIGKGRYIRTSNAKKVSTAHSSSSAKKTTSKQTSYAWSSSTKAFARSELLKMVNSYRSAAGVAPMKMDTNAKHQAYVDRVAANFAKECTKHPGYIFADRNNVDPGSDVLWKPFLITSTENVMAAGSSKSIPQRKQVTEFVTFVKNRLNGQKHDYDDDIVYHKRNTITNMSGTIMHYKRFIDPKLDTAVIGLGTYTKGNTTMVAMFFALPY